MWEKSYCLFVDGLVRSSQEITLFTHYTVGQDEHYALLADTTVDSILKYNEDPWVAVDIFGTVKWLEEKSVVFGSGAMGNDGFIALVAENNKLIWSYSFDFTNPVISGQIENNLFSGVTELGKKIIIDLGEPCKIRFN